MALLNFYIKWQLPCSLFISLFMLLASASGSADNDTTARDLKKLKQTIEALRKELDATKSTRDEVSKTLEKTEKNISVLSKRVKEIQQQLENQEENLQQLRDERSQLNQQKHQQEGLVSDYLNAAYRLGQQGNLRLLLNQEDPTRVARNLKYYDYFIRARTEKITQYVNTIKRINSIEPEIAYETQRIEQNLAQLKNQQSRLQSAQKERKLLLTTLDSRIVSQDQKLRNLTEDRRRLEELMSKVIENIADIKLNPGSQKFSNLKGKLPWPTQGRVLKRFGSSRVANKMRWEGLLIDSAEGDPVKAVHYGQVVFSDYLRGHGLLLILDHGGGFMSLYAHNQALFKELGEWVNSGDTIASVGSSGGQKDAALYFELRYKGKPTDPQRWLRSA